MTENPSQPHDEPQTGGHTRTASTDASASRPVHHAGHAIVDELRVLRRSSSDRVVAGVMGGAGERLGIDPVVLRIVTAVLALFGGVGVLIYAVAWLLVPADNEAGSIFDQALGRVEPRQPNAGPLALGLGLAALVSAGFVVGGSVVSGPLLVGAAAAGYLLLRRRDEQADINRAAAAPGDDHVPEDLPRSWPSDRAMETSGPPSLYAPPGDDTVGARTSQAWVSKGDDAAGGVGDGSVDATPAVEDTVDDAVEAPAGGPADSASDAKVAPGVEDAGMGSGWPDGPDWAPPPTPPSDGTRWAAPDPGEPAVPTKTKHRSPLGPITFSAALVAVGILAIVDASTDFHVGLYFAIPLAIIGVGLVIGSWFGRSRGLIALGVVLALALPVATWADEFDGEWGRESYQRITTLADFPREPVDIGAGRVTYDLAELDLSAGQTGELAIDMGTGDLTILVPREADLEVNASIGAGSLVVRNDSTDGVGSEIKQTFEGEGLGGGTIELDIEMGAGNVKVVDR